MNWCMNNEMAIYIGYGRKRNSGLDIKCHNVIIVLHGLITYNVYKGIKLK